MSGGLWCSSQEIFEALQQRETINLLTTFGTFLTQALLSFPLLATFLVIGVCSPSSPSPLAPSNAFLKAALSQCIGLRLPLEKGST